MQRQSTPWGMGQRLGRCVYKPVKTWEATHPIRCRGLEQILVEDPWGMCSQLEL